MSTVRHSGEETGVNSKTLKTDRAGYSVWRSAPSEAWCAPIGVRPGPPLVRGPNVRLIYRAPLECRMLSWRVGTTGANHGAAGYFSHYEFRSRSGDPARRGRYRRGPANRPNRPAQRTPRAVAKAFCILDRSCGRDRGRPRASAHRRARRVEFVCNPRPSIGEIGGRRRLARFWSRREGMPLTGKPSRRSRERCGRASYAGRRTTRFYSRPNYTKTARLINRKIDKLARAVPARMGKMRGK